MSLFCYPGHVDMIAVLQGEMHQVEKVISAVLRTSSHDEARGEEGAGVPCVRGIYSLIYTNNK